MIQNKVQIYTFVPLRVKFQLNQSQLGIFQIKRFQNRKKQMMILRSGSCIYGAKNFMALKK